MTAHMSLYLVFAGEESATHFAGVSLGVSHAHVNTPYMPVQVTAHDKGAATVITGVLQSVVHLAHVVPVFEADMKLLSTQTALIVVGVIMHLVDVMVAHPWRGKLLPTSLTFVVPFPVDVLHVVT